jgi:aminoglycoside phosphotransferase
MPHPRTLWPELTLWEPAGMEERVYRVQTPTGDTLYVRPDDGSPPLLARLAATTTLPVPHVLDTRRGWLLLTALPGIPLHHPSWYTRPLDVAHIVATVLRALDAADVTHGDLCLPNLLGDPETGALTGIVDWRYAEKYGPDIDVAAAVWSCDFNGYGEDVAVNVLKSCGWQPATHAEVSRLHTLWTSLPPATPPPDAHSR